MDVPTAYLEGKASSVRARMASRLVPTQPQGMPLAFSLDDISLLTSMIERERGRQSTLKSIGMKTIEIIADASDTDGEDSNGTIENDWIDVFSSHADSISNEKMQTLWARILANKIRTPKSILLLTIRALSVIDEETATLFEKVSSIRIRDRYIPRPVQISRSLVERIMELEEVGLIHGFDSENKIGFPANAEGYFIVDDGELGLHARTDEKEFQLSYAQLTRAGLELTRILPPRNSTLGLRAVFGCNAPFLFNASIVRRFESKGHGSTQFKVIQPLEKKTTLGYDYVFNDLR